MNYKELAEISQAQNKVLMATIESLNSSLTLQGQTIESMSVNIQSLTDELVQLRKLLLERDEKAEALVNKLNGLVKIALPKKIEKRKVSVVDKTIPAPTPKERGNNGAKRKVYDLEEVVEDVEPTHSEFTSAISSAVYLFSRDVIRYKYIPPRLIKHIYRCKSYRVGDTVYDGKAPIAPFLNSNFDSSVIANLIQQRFVYGMPVERIVRQYNEMGIDLPKQTAHGLLTKVGDMLDRLNPVLKDAVLSESYIHFDETYHTVLDKSREKGSYKGYFWAALSPKSNLMHFFYADGSRGTKVFTDYLPKTYNGAIQTDGYISYKKVEGWDYPKTIRLGCVQHCKRYFFDIETQKEAKEIIDIYNEFYQIRKNSPKEKWIKKSLKVYDKLKKRLREIERSKEVLCNSILSKGITYCLNELESIYNIIVSTEYDLDNNQIERPMRYISISRKNSMFCGSHKGANRMALIYSLAISCRLNNVNTFTYFYDIINCLAELPPNVTNEELRELLPDKWAIEK